MLFLTINISVVFSILKFYSFFHQVNEDSVEHMSTADIIDLLRKIRGSIGITVMRKSKRDNVT